MSDAEDRDLELAQVIEGMEVPAPSQAYFEVLRARIKKALRSDFSRNRVFGCQTNRKKSAVQTTEKTPATTSVTR